MQAIQRRTILTGIGVAALAAGAGSAWAQTLRPGAASAPQAKPRPVAKLAPKLRIIIPANPGGGWDQTGRALGAALLGAGLTDAVEYENKGGKGGTIGLAHYAEKYSSDANTLLIGGTVMVGAVALQKPTVDLSRVHPIARLTSDYLVVVVSADSPIQNVTALAERIRSNTKSVSFAGGSAGGVDHVFSGIFVRSARGKLEDMVYQPFAGGVEVVQAVLSGKAMVGVSGYSEFSEHLASGRLRAIGVSSKRSVFGLPAVREQGVEADMANWRAVFTGQAVAAPRREELMEGVKMATQHASWQKVLKDNRWVGSWLSGREFSHFIDFEFTTALVMAHLLKLKT